MSTKNESASLVHEFADLLVEIPEQIITGLLSVTEDEDERLIIDAYTTAFKTQFREISDFIKTSADQASAQQLKDGVTVVRVFAGIELCRGIQPLSFNLGSIIGKIGLKKLFDEIKKLIEFILDKINLPKWLMELILLLDQILANLLGIGSPKLASTLSRMEQDYLSELTHLAILKRERRYLFDETEEDDLI